RSSCTGPACPSRRNRPCGRPGRRASRKGPFERSWQKLLALDPWWRGQLASLAIRPEAGHWTLREPHASPRREPAAQAKGERQVRKITRLALGLRRGLATSFLERHFPQFDRGEAAG